jgi:hypothetical protein
MMGSPDGKVLMVLGYYQGDGRSPVGTYRVEGSTLLITWKKGNPPTPRYTIRRLTASEMVWSCDGGSKEYRLVRYEPLHHDW